jgi:A/G-specific adenine glycosylase
MNCFVCGLPVKALLRWERYHGRRPPWRSSTDPFHLAVAEVLLQKTKAHDVVSVWEKLIAEMPTATSLAEAKKKDVHTIVKCLGLATQRTTRLKTMARAWISQDVSGHRLPGLGPYGNSVILLAMGRDHSDIPIDGNISRVIARYCGLKFSRGEPRKKLEVKETMRQVLCHLPKPRARLFAVYALVDLGALICRSHKPSCDACPLRPGCAFAGN